MKGPGGLPRRWARAYERRQKCPGCGQLVRPVAREITLGQVVWECPTGGCRVEFAGVFVDPGDLDGLYQLRGR